MIVCPTLNRASGGPEWFNLLDYMVRLDWIRWDSGIKLVARWVVVRILANSATSLRHPHPGPLSRLEDSPQGEGGMKALEKEMMRALS